MNANEKIKSLNNSDKLILGTKETLTNLKLGKVESIYLSSNCPATTKTQIESVANDIEIVNMDLTNEELGSLCKKPYTVSVISILK